MNLTDDELKLARRRYNDQKSATRSRVDKNGNQILFKLTFSEWLDIWVQSGHYHERGRKVGQYCMSRYNDIGHYELGNVEIKLFSKNVSENMIKHKMPQYQKDALLKSVAGVKKSAEHCQKISEAKSIKVSTPEGIFNSIKLAAEHYGRHTKWIHNRLKSDPLSFYRLL